MTHHTHESAIVDYALDEAWDIATANELFKWLPPTQVDPGEWVGDIDVETEPDGYCLRVKCSANGTLLLDATYQYEGGFGDDGLSGGVVLQTEHERYG
jgi:hypothetical protein